VVLADRDRLTQVMINLLSNAVKFVPADTGMFMCRVGHPLDNEVRVEVSDNGPGLTAEECTSFSRNSARAETR
jgi:signal transduction histidine kinase